MATTYAPSAERDPRSLRAHVAQLESDLARTNAEIARLGERRKKIETELGSLAGLLPAEPELDGIRSIGERPRPASLVGAVDTGRSPVATADIARMERKAALLQVFSLAELAAATGLSPAAVRKWAKDRQANGLLAPAGKAGAVPLLQWTVEVEEIVTGDEDFPPREQRATVIEAAPAVNIKAAGEAEAEVRHWVEGESRSAFSLADVAKATGLSEDLVDKGLGALARYGVIRDVGVGGMELYERVPEGERPRARPVDGSVGEPERGVPVPGTGRHHSSNLTISHPETRALVNAIQKAGGEVRHSAQGHLEVTFEGKRCLISSTPSSPRSVLSDRARVRRLGLVLA